jgi:hypothetical protein
MSNTVMGEVRSALLETLRDMKAGKMKADDAKAVASVAQTLINSYTLQVRALNAMGGELPREFVKELTGGEPAAEPPRKLPAVKPNGGAPPDEGIHAKDPLYGGRRDEPAGRTA